MDTGSHGQHQLPINGIDLCVETFGDRDDPAILFIDGAAASMLWWETGLCGRIAAAGRFVIRYDNRDTGRSTSYPPGAPGYSTTDWAEDVLGILDEFSIDRAHIVCRSMSGGVGLILGVDHSDRVATLTFVSTSTGAPGLPPSSPALHENETTTPDYSDHRAVVDFVVSSARRYSGGSPYFDEAAVRRLVEADVLRANNIESTLTNHYRMRFTAPRSGSFADITAPALIVHGDLDPLLPLPHGEALRDAIPGARLLILSGAGHDLPRPLWDSFVEALLEHTAA